ncbi:tyrosine-type recombinase/integrase [Methanomethylovorans sp.]|uniref:tyrosine-type recombinase/integrase n=1 Tax=Methanomethylovorans sp. TaxID=2758717 RepID=UPI00351C2366
MISDVKEDCHNDVYEAKYRSKTDLVDNYIFDLKLQQLRPHTIENYVSDVNHFLKHIKSPTSIGQGDLQKYLHVLLGSELADSTLKSYFISLNSFYDFLVYDGYCQKNPIPPFRKRYLPRREVQQKRQTVDLFIAQKIIKRTGHILDKTIHALFAKTGIRREELIILKKDDLHLSEEYIKGPVTGKRLEHRHLFLDTEMMEIMLDYLDWRDEYAKSDYLFISPAGSKLHKDYPGRYLRKVGEELGIHDHNGPLDARLTPHCWRHFFTTQMHKGKMDPEYIKYLRGDIMTREAWEIYNHLDIEDIRRAYLMCSPKLL